MTRKGKRKPTESYHERTKLTSYGTTTARIGTEGQRRFGVCCLGLELAKDPVATPSGHIYSREAIISYLLKKTQELKTQRSIYDSHLAAKTAASQTQDQKSQQTLALAFLSKDQGASQKTTRDHSRSLLDDKSKSISVETKEEGLKTLSRTSYWLSDFGPGYERDETANGPPPTRPSSPMSGRPLRLKDLISLDIKEENENAVVDRRFVCSVSGKALTTQPVVAIKKTGKVMLKEVYETLAKPSMTCPVTGKKFKERDVIELQKGSSGFAASGSVVAKMYRPTLT